jgi:protein-S-isoprenylcysteine O-methyltransferase Ste14
VAQGAPRPRVSPWLWAKNLLFTVLVPGTVAGYVPWLIAAPAGNAAPHGWGPLRFAAALSLSAGVALYFACLWQFTVTGRGTPAPIDAPARLVVRGPYRFVRNPMYLGVLLVVLGWSAYCASLRLLVYAAAIACFFHLFVVAVEEPVLRRKFAGAFEAYCRSVHRWRPGRPYLAAAE